MLLQGHYTQNQKSKTHVDSWRKKEPHYVSQKTSPCRQPDEW